MSDSSGAGRVRDLLGATTVNAMTFPRRGWTEWYRYSSGRFRETIVYRRRNPFEFHGPLAAAWLLMYGGLKYLAGIPLPGFTDAVMAGLTDSSPFSWLPIAAVGLLLAWGVAGVWARRHTREEDVFDRDSMYPPADYWEGFDVE